MVPGGPPRGAAGRGGRGGNGSGSSSKGGNSSSSGKGGNGSSSDKGGNSSSSGKGGDSSSSDGSDGSEKISASRPRAGGPPAASPATPAMAGSAPSTSTVACWPRTASSTGGPPRGRSR